MNMMDLTMIMITPDNVLRIANYKRILFRPLSLQKNSVPCRISSNTSLILMWSKLVSNPQLVAARSLTCTHAHTYLNMTRIMCFDHITTATTPLPNL